jgi:hypothetical protein
MAANPPNPPVAFALTPAHQTQALLNFQEKREADTYYKGCAPLEGDPYDGTSLADFLSRIQARADQFGWESILTIQNQNLLTDYGVLSRADVQAHAQVYQPLNDRRAQNSNMLYNCVRTSISTKVREKVNINPSRYIIEFHPQPNAPIVKRFDGVCYLKAVIDDTYVNTLSNTAVARSNLSSLDKYMRQLQDNDVTKFNQYVNENLQELAAAGETTNDLLVNLFDGYKEVKDKRFRKYIEGIEDQWTDRTLQLDPNGTQLMEKAENYFKGLTKKGKWLNLDEDQETIIALKALLSKQKQKSFPTKKESPMKKKEKDWKSQAPKKGEPKKKTVKVNNINTTYHWCPYHQRWTVHPPHECRKKGTTDSKKKGKESTIPTKKSDDDGADPTLKVMAAIKEEDAADGDALFFPN